MNFNRSLVAIVSIFALSLSASGCVFSPAQDEVGLKKMQMETQVSSIGLEEDAETDLDADLDAGEMDAEISKEEEENGSVFGRIPPMRIVGSIRPIDERENIPISIGDISIMPYPDPVDATIAAGGDYWQQFTASAYGNPGMYFAWTVTGLPAGLTYSLNGSYSQNLVIYGAPTVAGSYPLFLRAAQYADSTNYEEHSYTLVVSAEGDDDDDDDDEVDNGDPCSQPLEVKIKEIGELTICPEGYTGPDNCFDPATDALPSTLGKKFSIGLEVSGGKAPYVWKVDNRVKDSFHRYNAGEGEPGKFPRGITNYEYRYPDKPCLSPEEVAEIAASMSMDQFGSFWPDCSDWMHLTYDQKALCEKIGCSKEDWPNGPYGSPEHELALQCVSGFNCPSGPGGMLGLTEGQRKACEEYETWVNKNKKTIELQGAPRYICKWTHDPTWRKEGVEVPKIIHKTEYGVHPSENWEWDPPRRYGTWSPEKSYSMDGNTITFITDNEFDGPLPVNRSAYAPDGDYRWGKPSIEQVTFMVTDSCPVAPLADGDTIVVKRIGTASLDVALDHPDAPITDFKVGFTYEGMNLECDKDDVDGECPAEDYQMQLLFMDSAAMAMKEGGHDVYSSWLENVGVWARFFLLDLEWAGDNETDVVISDRADESNVTVPNNKDVAGIDLRLFTGWDWRLEQKLGDGVVGWHEYTKYGDMDIRHIYITNRYWQAQYDDARAGDIFNKDVGDAERMLSDLDGWEDMNNKAAPFGFYKRDVIPGKFMH